MTNQNDALVMEALGNKVRCLKSGEWQYEVTPGQLWRTVIPYVTDPTHATDGIVLEWVQGQGSVYFFNWSKKYGEIVRVINPKGTAFPRERFYKPGDYAKALLAVLQEERGE